MQRRKYELQVEAKNCDINLKGWETKEQIMDRLAQHYGTRTLLQLPCQLARNVKDLREEHFEKILQSSNWIAEYKLDGCRVKLHLMRGGNRIDSRHRSTKTYEYVEKTASLPQLANLRANGHAGTVLDGEVIMPVDKIDLGKTQTLGTLTSTTAVLNSHAGRALELQQKFGWMSFVPFDILFYGGKDVRKEALARRLGYLADVAYNLELRWPKTCIFPGKSKRSFFERALGEGFEGIMLKDLRATYSPKEGQRPKHWYKWKKMDTIDLFITDFVPGQGEFSGLIGALLCSVMDKDTPVEVAAVQPGDLSTRHQISDVDGSLVDHVYGKVLEVSYQEVTKNHRLRHPTLVKWRPDKTMYDCTRCPH